MNKSSEEPPVIASIPHTRKAIDAEELATLLKVETDVLKFITKAVGEGGFVDGTDYTIHLDADFRMKMMVSLTAAMEIALLHGNKDAYRALGVLHDRRRKGAMNKAKRLMVEMFGEDKSTLHTPAFLTRSA